jgi:hypothetical protein
VCKYIAPSNAQNIFHSKWLWYPPCSPLLSLHIIIFPHSPVKVDQEFRSFASSKFLMFRECRSKIKQGFTKFFEKDLFYFYVYSCSSLGFPSFCWLDINNMLREWIVMNCYLHSFLYQITMNREVENE